MLPASPLSTQTMASHGDVWSGAVRPQGPRNTQPLHAERAQPHGPVFAASTANNARPAPRAYWPGGSGERSAGDCDARARGGARRGRRFVCDCGPGSAGRGPRRAAAWRS